MSDGGKGSKPRPFSVDTATFDSNWDQIFGRGAEKQANENLEKFTNDYQDILSTEDCVLDALDKLKMDGNYDCHRCYQENDARVNKMIVCPVCGNKRCPRASDHRLECTGSNEPGQAGSVY